MSDLNGITFAIDFDGTCVTHKYPAIGRFIGAERVLRRIIDNGGLLILNTMRSGPALEAAVEWFSVREIPLYGIQTNPKQSEWTTSPKCYANVYIDDAALGCPKKPGLTNERPYVDWDAVEKFIFGDEKQIEPS